jgi:hypothetical protein
VPAVNVPILKYVDILIGLSLIMVLLSTIVLAVTQMLLNSSFARARHLQRGLTRMIRSLEPATLQTQATYLSRLMLRHPLIGQQTGVTTVRRIWRRLVSWWAPARADQAAVLPALSPGAVIQREELAYLLIELASGESPLMDPLENRTVPPKIAELQTAVAAALLANGIEDPAATLRAIRLKVVENERAEPNMPAHRWRADAVADCAPGDFVAKIHASFDNTMARVTDSFTGESKLWVVAASLLVVVALQIDIFQTVKRLSIDDSYRQTLVELAQRQPVDASAAAVTDAAEVRKQADASLKLLSSPAINLFPERAPVAQGAPLTTRLAALVPPAGKVPGILFAWVLLSLGAPFWFDMLKNLLKLRSLLAKKDESEREQRDTAQPPVTRSAAPAASSVPAGALAGEAGDLTATGALG